MLFNARGATDPFEKLLGPDRTEMTAQLPVEDFGIAGRSRVDSCGETDRINWNARIPVHFPGDKSHLGTHVVPGHL